MFKKWYHQRVDLDWTGLQRTKNDGNTIFSNMQNKPRSSKFKHYKTTNLYPSLTMMTMRTMLNYTSHSSTTWKIMRKRFFWACWTSSNFSSSRSMPSLVGTARSSSAEKSSRLCCGRKQNDENYTTANLKNNSYRKHIHTQYPNATSNIQQVHTHQLAFFCSRVPEKFLLEIYRLQNLLLANCTNTHIILTRKLSNRTGFKTNHFRHSKRKGSDNNGKFLSNIKIINCTYTLSVN